MKTRRSVELRLTMILLLAVFICIMCGRKILVVQAAAVYPDQTELFYVADYAGLLSDENEKIIIDENVELYEKSGAQICVLTVEDLSGDTIENFANETFRKWGIGDADKNNGVLILVSEGDRKDRIEVGYGLEGDLTDSECAQILKDGNSFLKDNDWESGIMTIYTEVAAKVHGVYDMEYKAGFGGDQVKTSAEDADDVQGEEDEVDQEAIDAFDAVVGSLWFKIPAILIFLLVYFLRIFGDHGFFIRFLQVVFTIGLVGLSLLMIIVGEGGDVPEVVAMFGVLYVILAAFNAFIAFIFDGVGYSGGSGGSSGGGWSSGGGGFSGGGGSSGGGGASGSF